jgi:hypothetical protein
VQRAARASTHDLCHLLRGGVLRLDPWPLSGVEDLRQATDALGEVQAPASVVEDGFPCVVVGIEVVDRRRLGRVFLPFYRSGFLLATERAGSISALLLS